MMNNLGSNTISTYANDDCAQVVKTHCYNCLSNDNSYFDSEYGYDLVKCNTCGLLYVNPRPSEKYIENATMYGVHIGNSQKVVTGNYHRYKIKIFKNALKDLYMPDTFQKKDMKWLDIGCGYGEFIEALTSYCNGNVEVHGIDPNLTKIESALKRGLTVSNEKLEDINIKFNFISLLNVYSHLPNPVDFLENIKRYLEDDGELLLQTGHLSHLPKEYQTKPYGLPDHLSFANMEIVSDILETMGFDIITVKLYRSSVYPKYNEFMKIIKLLVKVAIRRGEKLNYLWPEHPDTDMYIRCKLVSN